MWIALFTLISSLHAQTIDSWKRLDFLLGQWTGVAGEKAAPQGPGQGAFSFTPELSEKIIVRRNNAQFDSGASHGDLMVIYRDAPEDGPRAIYFDSEGHVIRYKAAFPSEKRVVFESDGTQPGPKYRLTYWMDGAQLKGQFEVAPPGKEYQTYLQWGSVKK